jgi:hypothetical protein
MRRPMLLLVVIVSTVAAAVGGLAWGARRSPHRLGLTSWWT